MGLNIKIEDPCHEDWDKMSIGVINRHCSQCDKDVHDFTVMSRAEILEFMLLNARQPVCGRFRKDQLDYTLEEINESMNSILSRTVLPFQKELIVTTAAILLASCNPGGPDSHANNTKPAITELRASDTEDTITEVIRDTVIRYDDELHIESGERLNNEKHLDHYDDVVVVTDTIIKEYPLTKIEMYKPHEPMIMGILPYTHFNSGPYFRFGPDSLQNFVSNRLKEEVKQLDSGKVVGVEVRFKITRWGRVRDVSIVEANNVDEKLQNKIKRAVRKSKGWVPYRNNKNKRQSTYFTTTIFLKNE